MVGEILLIISDTFTIFTQVLFLTSSFFPFYQSNIVTQYLYFYLTMTFSPNTDILYETLV